MWMWVFFFNEWTTQLNLKQEEGKTMHVLHVRKATMESRFGGGREKNEKKNCNKNSVYFEIYIFFHLFVIFVVVIVCFQVLMCCCL